MLLCLPACGAAASAERPVLNRSSSGVPQVLTVAAIPVARSSHRVQMPWIWRVLRRGVYRRLPRIRSRRRGLAAVVSPVIVDGPYDSVPGVGLEGGF